MHRLPKTYLKITFLILFTLSIIVGTLSAFTYTNSLNNFNRHIETTNQNIVKQLAITLEAKVITPTTALYKTINYDLYNNAGTLLSFEDDLQGNHYKIKATMEYLENQLLKNPIIEEISIYYIHQNILISSRSYKRFNDSSQTEERYLSETLTRLHLKQESTWVSPMNASYFNPSQNALLYSNAYPSIGDKIKGYISITVSEDAINDLILSNVSEKYAASFITDQAFFPNGDTFYRAPSTLQEVYFDSIGTLKDEANNANNRDDFFVKTPNHYITVSPIALSPFYLINVLDMNQLYSQARGLRVQLILVVIISLLLAAGLSLLAARKVYTPIGRIFAKSNAILYSNDDKTLQPLTNEYQVINYALDNLTNRVSDLNHVITANQRVLKNTLLNQLINNRIDSMSELVERANMIQMNIRGKRHLLVIAKFHPSSSTSNRKVFLTQKLSLFGQIENLPLSDGHVHCIDLAMTSFGLLISFNSISPLPQINDFIHNINTLSDSSFSYHYTWMVSPEFSDILSVSNVYIHCNAYNNYHFYASLNNLTYTDTIDEAKPLRPIHYKGYMDKLKTALNSRNIDQVELNLQAFCQELSRANYSEADCNVALNQLYETIISYLRRSTFIPNEMNGSELSGTVVTTSHITSIPSVLTEIIAKAFDYINSNIHPSIEDLNQKIIRYINEHYAEDISMSQISNHLNTSPRQLAKLFKEEHNQNLVGYLNDFRLDKACQLLLDSHKTIKQISASVGFNSPAYFNKKFKEKYGYTPQEFKNLNA